MPTGLPNSGGRVLADAAQVGGGVIGRLGRVMRARCSTYASLGTCRKTFNVVALDAEYRLMDSLAPTTLE